MTARVWPRGRAAARLALLLLLALAACPVLAQGEEEGYFEHRVLPGIGAGIVAPFAGSDADGDWIVAAGEGSSRVLVLPRGEDSWREAGALAGPLAGGAAASTPRGLLCVGGAGANGALSTEAFLLEWKDGALEREGLAPLPMALEGVAATARGETLLVHGLDSSGQSFFLSLDTSREGGTWEALPSPPGPPVSRPSLAAFGDTIYLLGGTGAAGEPRAECHAYAGDAGWRAIASAPSPLAGVHAARCGEAHLVVLGAPWDPQAILAYHTVTGTWAPSGRLPRDPGILALASSGLDLSIIGSEASLRSSARLVPTKYGWIDHGVVALYLGAMLLIGGVLAKREKGTADFFRGGRRIPWWASGLSMFATAASAISLMAMPGKSYSGDWTYFSASVYAVLMLPLAMFVYVPIVRRLDVSTANEYLERRFNLSTRLFGAVIYSLNQMLGRMATIMLLPAIALSSIVGLPIEQSILIMGLVTTIYVTAGGLEAVIWTDVVQSLVMVGSVLLCMVWAFMLLTADPAASFQTITDANKLRVFDMSLDLTKATALAMLLNVIGGTTGMLGDQNFIQRVQCTASESLAKKAVATQIAVAVPLNVILFSLGTVLFLFYRENPGQLNPAIQSDGIFPLFAAQNLPPGVAGIVVAALLAATMSTLSSAVNSTANLGVEDFYRRLVPGATDRACLVLGRWLSVILGVLGTGAALLLARTSLESVWDLAILVMGLVGAPIVGIFGLGVFTRRANSLGVLVGGVACIISTILLRAYTDLNAFLFLPSGFVVCFVVGFLASHLVPTPPEKVKGLTAYTLLGKRHQKAGSP